MTWQSIVISEADLLLTTIIIVLNLLFMSVLKALI